MNSLTGIAKKKKRLILVLSAAAAHSGMQCLYIETSKKGWQILGHQTLPYAPQVRGRIDEMMHSSSVNCSLRDIASLDCELSLFALECAKSVLSRASRPQAAPDIVLLNRLCLWKGPVNNEKLPMWSFQLGDPQVLASGLKAVVATDFVQREASQPGNTVCAGDYEIARKAGELALFVNIGLVSHMTLIDTRESAALIDSDTGPGAWLMNRAARQAGCAEGFDRDGSAAASGKADPAAVETLAGYPWFRAAGPKHASLSDFDALLRDRCLGTLMPLDVLATMTALAARTIFNFFKQEYRLERMPTAVWISGGATYNQAIVQYLSAYFSPIPVKSVEELGIPPDSFVPLSLALSLHAALDNLLGRQSSAKSGAALAKWIIP